MHVFITELDEILIDKDGTWDAALPALNMLERLHLPLVLCTTRTRAQVEPIRRLLRNQHPFIVENGGALYIPAGYFSLTLRVPVRRDGYAVIEFGDPYSDLVQTLREASAESRCPVRGFHQMTTEEISESYHIKPEAAGLARQREYDEPFEILGDRSPQLLQAIEKRKKRWIRGWHFYHILGVNDKAHCVNLLCYFYRRTGGDITTVGIGSGINDVAFLSCVDIALVLGDLQGTAAKAAVAHARFYPQGGPKAWNEAVMDILETYPTNILQPSEEGSIHSNSFGA